MPQLKRNLISRTINLVYELPHELQNNLRLRISGNKETLKNSQIWMETKPSAQPPFKKSNFGKSSKKKKKKNTQKYISNFLVLSNFTGLSFLVPITLSWIVWANKCFVITWSNLLHTSIFWQFLQLKSISLIFDENKKLVSCAKVPNIMVLC